MLVECRWLLWELVVCSGRAGLLESSLPKLESPAIHHSPAMGRDRIHRPEHAEHCVLRASACAAFVLALPAQAPFPSWVVLFVGWLRGVSRGVCDGLLVLLRWRVVLAAVAGGFLVVLVRLCWVAGWRRLPGCLGLVVGFGRTL